TLSAALMQLLALNLKQPSSAKRPGVASATEPPSVTAISYRSLILLIVVLSLFLGLQFFVPLRTAIKIGADEDWELSKATLVLNGYHFYTEVWNDQPLLHTFIIK